MTLHHPFIGGLLDPRNTEARLYKVEQDTRMLEQEARMHWGQITLLGAPVNNPTSNKETK